MFVNGMVWSLALLLTAGTSTAPSPPAGCYFRITVVDEQTGRGVPLVELSTVNHIRCYTDSQGVVAFHEPGLMGRKVFFVVKSHGYEHAADGFGQRGVALEVVAGGSAVLKVKRINIAERLYRITGGGIYRDSTLLGLSTPLEEPVLNGQVFGQDTVQEIVYRGKIYWFWGDTSKPGYPLGIFQTSGATSLLPSAGGLDPDVGVNLTYWVDEHGFSRKMTPMPGSNPVWITGLVTIPDPDGRERLYCYYSRIQPPLSTMGAGQMLFNDDQERFEPVAEFDIKAPLLPSGQAFRHRSGGVEYFYYALPFPTVRVPATREALLDQSQIEAYTPLKTGSTREDPQIDRDAAGVIRYAWRRQTAQLDDESAQKLIDAQKLQPGEVLLQLQDIETGKKVRPHNGCVYWNDYRKRWITIRSEIMGTSMLGEVWYAEADSPLGPWVYARKVVTHDKYSFYNPLHHPVFDKEGGRIIYFEGTYTNSFSGNDQATPRYEYNQVMYKLDLGDLRMALPVPVYALPGGELRTHHDLKAPPPSQKVEFFAWDRPAPGAVAVFEQPAAGGGMEWVDETRVDADRKPNLRPVFYALPLDVPEPPAGTCYFCRHSEAGGKAVYRVSTERPADKETVPLFRVWRCPLTLPLPLGE